MKMRTDDEDDRIRKAVEEAEERRAREDAEKEAKARKMIAEANEHRVAMVRLPGDICGVLVKLGGFQFS